MIEQNLDPSYISVFTNHFLTRPVENKALLHTLFIESDGLQGKSQILRAGPRLPLQRRLKRLGFKGHQTPL